MFNKTNNLKRNAEIRLGNAGINLLILWMFFVMGLYYRDILIRFTGKTYFVIVSFVGIYK